MQLEAFLGEEDIPPRRAQKPVPPGQKTDLGDGEAGCGAAFADGVDTRGPFGSDWAPSVYAISNRGAAPSLTITQVGLLSWWHRFLGAPRGYIFFTEEGFQLHPGPQPGQS